LYERDISTEYDPSLFQIVAVISPILILWAGWFDMIVSRYVIE